MKINVIAFSYHNFNDEWVYTKGIYDGKEIHSKEIIADSCEGYIFSDKYTFSPETGDPIFERIGLAKANGEVLLKPQYEEIGAHTYDYFCVQKNGLWGVVDEEETVIVPFQYEETTFSWLNGEFELFRAKLGGLWGILNNSGEVILPHQYDEISNYNDEFFCTRKGKTWGVVDRTNRVIIPFKYHHIKILDGSENRMLDGKKLYSSKRPCFQTKVGKKTGFVSFDGTVLQEPELVVLSEWIDSPLPEHQHAFQPELFSHRVTFVFIEKFLCVKKGGQYALLDEQFNLWFEKTPSKRGSYCKKIPVGETTLLVRVRGRDSSLKIIKEADNVH